MYFFIQLRQSSNDALVAPLLLIYLIDLFQAGLWSQRIQPMCDKSKSLADSLPAFVLSKAISSNVKCKSACEN